MKDEINIYRDLIKHENELTNHRLNWFILMQGMMFAGLGAMWGPDVYPLRVLSALGLIVCIPFGYALRMNNDAVTNLLRMCKEANNGEDPSPPIIGYDQAKHAWLLPWNSVPVIFAIAWSVFLYLLFTSYPPNA